MNNLTISSSEGLVYVGGKFVVVVDGNVGSGYAAQFTDSQNPLPVELTSFSAIKTDEGIILDWQTATEVNNYGFEIQRKSNLRGQENHSNNSDLEGYTAIGFVEGHGNGNSTKNYSFTDSPTGGSKFQYRLKQIDTDGKFEYSDVVEVEIELTTKVALEQNFPNPFNPTTKIRYSIPADSKVTLKLYDILGKEIAVLINEQKTAGNYTLNFNASNFSSGVYLYKLTSGKFIKVKKLMLVK